MNEKSLSLPPMRVVATNLNFKYLIIAKLRNGRRFSVTVPWWPPGNLKTQKHIGRRFMEWNSHLMLRPPVGTQWYEVSLSQGAPLEPDRAAKTRKAYGVRLISIVHRALFYIYFLISISPFFPRLIKEEVEMELTSDESGIKCCQDLIRNN